MRQLCSENSASLLQISKNEQIAIFVLRTTVVYVDGSTYNRLPRATIKPPFVLSTLTDAERKAELEKRKLKSKKWMTSTYLMFITKRKH
jgi:hypothetical protein